MRFRALIVAIVFLAAGARAQTAEQWLSRARDAMGMSRAADSVLHYHSAYTSEQNYQSERTYPPYFDAIVATDNWFSISTGVLRSTSQMTYPDAGGPVDSVTLADSERGVALRGDHAAAMTRSQLAARNLDAWAVIYDWSHATGVRVLGREVYRDYPRVVLGRATSEGEQRLLLDPKSGFPVKLEYTEPHYLWGQRHVEYVYSLWSQEGNAFVSMAAFRVADGDVETALTTSDAALVPATASGVPLLAMPAAPAPTPELPVFLQPRPPETIQVGRASYLLKNVGYTEAVTLARNEIYIFDATQGEERARQDEAAVHRIFPGTHKINLVVTDVAWPHIAGVRYWVARGATVISYGKLRPFLEKVVARRWTLHPDLLERSRASAHLNFVAIDAERRFAGGVRVAPIDGISSETALMAFVPGDDFLWASDYLQDASQPTEFGREIVAAVRRVGWAPQRVAAEHLALTPWQTITKLVEQPGSGAAGH